MPAIGPWAGIVGATALGVGAGAVGTELTGWDIPGIGQPASEPSTGGSLLLYPGKSAIVTCSATPPKPKCPPGLDPDICMKKQIEKAPRPRLPPGAYYDVMPSSGEQEAELAMWKAEAERLREALEAEKARKEAEKKAQEQKPKSTGTPEN